MADTILKINADNRWQLNVTKPGTTTLLTADKYMDRDIDIKAEAGSVSAAPVDGVEYKPLTDNVTVPSDGNLYIHPGFHAGESISLADLIPDDVTLDASTGAPYIAAGETAWDKDGNKIVGTMPVMKPGDNPSATTFDKDIYTPTPEGETGEDGKDGDGVPETKIGPGFLEEPYYVKKGSIDVTGGALSVDITKAGIAVDPSHVDMGSMEFLETKPATGKKFYTLKVSAGNSTISVDAFTASQKAGYIEGGNTVVKPATNIPFTFDSAEYYIPEADYATGLSVAVKEVETITGSSAYIPNTYDAKVSAGGYTPMNKSVASIAVFGGEVEQN